jgi:uncharacterized phage protein (TIGR02218 family)
VSAYDDADRAYQGAAPAELFQFSGGVAAYYCSGQRAVTWQGVEYRPDWILHNDLEQSDELNKQGLEITVRSECPVAMLYVEDIPATSVNVRVYRYIAGVEDFRLVWAGRVVKPVFSSEDDSCVLHCEPIYTMLKRPGLRRNYQLICPYCLYDAQCGLAMASWTTQVTVTAVSGGRVTISPSRGSGYYTGGVFRLGARHRLVINDSGSYLQLAGAAPGIAAGTRADVSAGCDKTLETCISKFSNWLNFGGFPYIPLKNPFTGDSVAS